MILKVKQLSERGKKPTKSKGNAGYDLYSAEEKIIRPLSRALIKTGIAIRIPDGYYGHISDRSGMAWNHGAHCMGKIIDPSFTGEIGIVIYNTDAYDAIRIAVGDRPAQILFKKFEEFDAVEWDEDLGETERGDKGWGNSGR